MDLLTSQKFKFFSFLSMVLLVFVHAYNLKDNYLLAFSPVGEPITFTTFFEYFSANGLFRFRIPMLFIISGFLFALNDSKPYWQRIKKRLKTLGIPYLIWSAFALLLTYVWQHYPVLADAVSKSQIDQLGDNRPYHEIGWAGMLFRWLVTPTAFQLWFIRSLLFYNLLYVVLKKAVTKIPKIWFGITIFLWLTSFTMPLLESEGLLFFTLGIYLQKINFNISEKPKWLNLKLFFILFILSAVVKSWLAFKLGWGVIPFIILSLLHKTCVFTGFVFMWYGCDGAIKFLMNKKWFTNLTSFSFMIYVLHVPLIYYITQLAFTHFNNLPYLRLISFIVLPLLLIAFCILVGAALRKTSKSFYSLLTGGRGIT